MKQYQLYINGQWVDPHNNTWFDTDEPFKAAPWAKIPRGSQVDADLAVQAAHGAFTTGDWPALNPTQRGHMLRRLGDLLKENAEDLALVEARDNGKRLNEAIPQFNYLPEWLYYYAGLADKIEGSVIPIDIPDVFNYTRYEPLGVVAAITPWNSPVMLALWKMAPALAAGNTVIIKPSEHASASTLELMRIVEQAEFPPGVVNCITGFAQEAGEPLVTHPLVAKVSFTGSEQGGRAINKLAADDFKRVTLELGGKSPQIVFEDAQLDNAVNGVLSGIFLSNGQTCVAGSRLLLHHSIHDVFLEKLKNAIQGLRIGDPSKKETQVGPIANLMQFEKIVSYFDIAREEGAGCVAGGKTAVVEGCENGWFVEPTIYTDVTPNMRVVSEEIFGPILGVMRFETEEQATEIANDSHYGLAAGVWTQNLRRAHLVAEKLKCGTVYINTYRAVSISSPAGGYKHSGIGRENGAEMIKEYLQTKSVWVSTAETIPNPLG